MMNNEFFLEQLRIADLKVKEQQKIENQKRESKLQVLAEFSNPIFEFLFFINKTYTLGAERRPLISYYSEENLRAKYSKESNVIQIPTVILRTPYGAMDYIIVRVYDDLSCTITYSRNTTQDLKVFYDLQSFITDFSEVIAINKNDDNEKNI